MTEEEQILQQENSFLSQYSKHLRIYYFKWLLTVYIEWKSTVDEVDKGHSSHVLMIWEKGLDDIFLFYTIIPAWYFTVLHIYIYKGKGCAVLIEMTVLIIYRL